MQNNHFFWVWPFRKQIRTLFLFGRPIRFHPEWLFRSICTYSGPPFWISFSGIYSEKIQLAISFRYSTFRYTPTFWFQSPTLHHSGTLHYHAFRYTPTFWFWSPKRIPNSDLRYGRRWRWPCCFTGKSFILILLLF